jgi:hypothetical protein
MNTFLITFEIKYPSLIPVQTNILINQIKSFNAWARPTNSVWLIKTYLPKEEVIKILRNAAGPSDKILVMKVSDEWISVNLTTEVINWMRSRPI